MKLLVQREALCIVTTRYGPLRGSKAKEVWAHLRSFSDWGVE